MSRRTVRARISLTPGPEGGRSGPIRSGYRSLARVVGGEQDFGFELELDLDLLAPGETGTGELQFWATDLLPPISEGQVFELREGTRIVGSATTLDASS